MITELAITENGHGTLVGNINVDQFKDYLRRNLTSDLVLEVLESCLLEENSEYAPINFEQALKDLQHKDTGRYQMLKALLEGFAMKEGVVLLDPKLVNASFKQRMQQLEALKAMSRFRRFWYRLAQAIGGLLTEKGETAAIQEAIQIGGEVQIGHHELAEIELKKKQAIYDTDQMMIGASNQARQKLEKADEQATKRSEEIFKEARIFATTERKKALEACDELHSLKRKVAQATAELAVLAEKKRLLIREDSRLFESQAEHNQLFLDLPSRTDLVKGLEDVSRRRLGESNFNDYSISRSPSVSPSPSPSTSASMSPSASFSISPSASPECDDDTDWTEDL